MDTRFWIAPLVIAVSTGLALTTILSVASAMRSPATRIMRATGVPARPEPLPLLGGLAILAAAMAASWIDGIIAQAQIFFTALGMAFAAGLWIEVAQRTRREAAAIEIIVVGLVVYAVGAQVRSLGIFAIPAVLGYPAAAIAVLVVLRCVNAMDVQGFRAWFGFVAIAWYAGFARRAGLEAEFVTALILDGAIAGYLLFDVLFVRRTGARVHLGHAGAMMIAVGVGVIGLDVSQTPAGGVSPMAALWVVLLPVMDSLSVLLARALRRAPLLESDQRHLHHYLRANDYTDSDIVFMLMWVSMLFGAVGYFTWKLGMSDVMILALAVLAFAAYHAMMARAWRKLAGYYVLF